MLVVMLMIFTVGKSSYTLSRMTNSILLESLMYDDEHVSFSDLPHDALTVFDYKSCHSCNSKATEVQLENDVQTDIGVVHHGVHYHADDFVFILPTGQSKLLDIGQITKFKGKLPNMEIHIRRLGRYDDYVMQQKKMLDLELTLDEVRCLFFHYCLLKITFSLSADCFIIMGHLLFQLINLMVYVMSSILLMKIRLRPGSSMTTIFS